MAFLVLGANSVSGYNVANSLRFNSGSSDKLTRTTSTPTSQQKFTWSAWCKRTKIGSAEYNIIQGFYTDANNYLLVGFNQDKIDVINYPNATTARKITTAVFRDVSAWYHIVVAVDTTQATATDRIKLYVNGSQVTAFSTDTAPSQNANLLTNATTNAIGAGEGGSIGYYNGYISEIYYIDGQALTTSSFGETDTDTGIWKPKAYTGTYGTNGFYLKFANSASLGTDSSGNGNTFTVNNLTSVDQTNDTPTNNFCTLNSLDNIASSTFTEGNLQIVTGVSSDTYNTATFGMTIGKWYWEAKFLSSGAAGNAEWGIVAQPSFKTTSGARLYQQSNSVSVNDFNYAVFANGSTTGISVGTYAQNDFINFAYDADNNAFYIGRNGTWLNSGVPTSGATKTGAFTAGTSGITYFPAVGDQNGSNGYSFQFNFGNPLYSSGSYTDGAGYGNFSYAVPSGYYSLCTKNLANFG